tara:strand:+ start:223 stop:423 length:201 start_codon:yes stop_codon:yes gene_type:complete
MLDHFKKIKYSKDDPKEFDIRINPHNEIDYSSNMDAYLLSSSIQIKNDLFPKIYQSIQDVKKKNRF